MNDCRSIRDLLVLPAAHWNDDERSRVQAHLATCAACAAMAHTYHGQERLLRRTRPERLSLPLWHDLETQLRRERKVVKMTRGVRSILQTVAGTFAVTVLVVVLITFLFRSDRRPADEEAIVTFACQNYQREQYEQLAQAFHEEHPRITVQILSTEEILSRTGGSTVIVASSDDIHRLAQVADTFAQDAVMLGDRPQDVALNLMDWAAHDAWFSQDDFYPAALAPFQHGDKLWGLPFEASTFFIYYSPAQFDAAGLPHPKIGWTWDDLFDAATRLGFHEEERIITYGYVDPVFYDTLLLLAHQQAGPLIVDRHDIPQARLDHPAVAEAVRWYIKLMAQPGVLPNSTQMDPQDLMTIASEASPAMWTGASWDWDSFDHRYEAGVAPFPEKDGQAAANLQVRGYLVSAGTAHPQASWRWIEWLSRQPPFRYSHSAPVRKSVIEATKHWDGIDPDLAAAFQYNLEHAVDYPGFVWHPLWRALEAVLDGTPADTALAQAQSSVNEALAQRAAEAAQSGDRFAVAAPRPTPTPGGTLVHFYVTQAFGADESVYRTLADRFQERHPTIAVEIESGLQPSLAGTAPIDCFVDHSYRVQMRGQSELLALDALAAGDKAFDREAYYPAFLQPLEINGRLMGLPLETSATMLYYHRGLFDQAGVPYPAAGWTPQQMVEQAVFFSRMGAPGRVYGFSSRDDAYSNAPQSIAWLGGELFDAGGAPAFDDPTVVAALALYADMVRSSPPAAQVQRTDRWSASLTTSVGIHPPAVGAGQVAMWTDNHELYLEAPPLDFQVGIAALPAGVSPVSDAFTRALFINAQTVVPDACWAWIAFLSAQPEAVQWFPVRRDIASGDAWRARVGQDTADAWASVLDQEALKPPSWGYSMTSYQALHWLDEALTEVLAGVPAADALAEAQAKASAFTRCMAEALHAEDAWRACAQQADPELVLPDE